MSDLWEVVGGVENGGILVREGEHITSRLLGDRLATGSLIAKLALNGDRLHYNLISGVGPYEGWVSTRIKGKELVTMLRASDTKGDGRHLTAMRRESKEKSTLRASIRLNVLGLDGKCLELDVAKNLTICELKRTLTKSFNCPVQCIGLILAAEPMIDAREINSYCRADDTDLCITAIISLQGLYTSLDESCTPSSRVTALQRLAEFAPNGCEDSIRATWACLESKAPSVRKEAVETLMKLAGTGHRETLLQLEARFQHKDPAIRLNAVLAWPTFLCTGETAEDHDDLIISKMSTLLQDSHPDVRSAAMDILRKKTYFRTAQKGDARVLSVAQSYMSKFKVRNNPFWIDWLWINPEQAEQMKSNGHAIFLDARDSTSFAHSHILGALSLPYSSHNELADQLAGIPFRSMIDYSEFSIIVYSDSGSPVSRCGLVAFMLHHGPWIEPYRVLRLNGGLNLWKYRGFAVEGDARPMYGGEFREFNAKENTPLGFELSFPDEMTSGIEELILG